MSSAVSPRACKLKGGSHTVGFGAFLSRCCSFEVGGVSPGLGLSLECGLGRPVGPVKPFLQNEFLLKTAKSCRKHIDSLGFSALSYELVLWTVNYLFLWRL